MRACSFALVALGTLAACGPELPPLRVEAGRCRVHTTAPVSLSTRLPEEHCAFGDRLTALTGLRTVPIDYALLTTLAESTAMCSDLVGRPASACARPGIVLSSSPLHGHELVHAVLGKQGLIGTSALQEGAADVFGRFYRTDAPVPHSMRLNDLVDETAFRDESPDGYRSAASFVSFLIDRAGEETFFDLLARTRRGTTLASLDAVGQTLYGETLSELHAEWAALPEEPAYSVHRPVYECGAPPLEDPGSIHFARGIAPDLFQAGAVRTFRVESSSELHLRMDGAPAPGAFVLGCDQRLLVVDVQEYDASELDVHVTIEPGDYAIWMTATVLEGSDDSVDVDVSLTFE